MHNTYFLMHQKKKSGQEQTTTMCSIHGSLEYQKVSKLGIIVLDKQCNLMKCCQVINRCQTTVKEINVHNLTSKHNNNNNNAIFYNAR